MKIIGVVKLNNALAVYLVVANSYEDPFAYLREEGADFLENGMLAFDLTLFRGYMPRHYALVRVEDHKLLSNTRMICDTLDKATLYAAHDYFNEHQDIVKRSVIPESIKRAVLNGDNLPK